MLEINYTKLILGYLYFSPNTFPKILQTLGGQLEIRLCVLALLREVHALSKQHTQHVMFSYSIKRNLRVILT